MSPDDDRHGSRRGYYAHRRAGQDSCDPCKEAAARAEMRYQHDRITGRARRVGPHGTRRRLQALSALGWTWRDIGAQVGASDSTVAKWVEPHDFYFATTAARVAEVYDRLCMTPREGWVGERTRKAARKHGYAPPLAWDNIDDPNERPTGQATGDGDDAMTVERILAGDWRLKANRAERFAVMDRWTGTDNELGRLTGWNIARMRRETRAVA